LTAVLNTQICLSVEGLATEEDSHHSICYGQGSKRVALATDCDVCTLVYSRAGIASTTSDQLARFAFDLVYTSHIVQAIYQALQSNASLGCCFWINPSGK